MFPGDDFSGMSTSRDRLVELRREFHRRPEVAWTEFWTTARVVEELRSIGVDELHVGPEVLSDSRLSIPEDEELAAAAEAAIEAGADPELVERMAGGRTGCVAVIEQGEGPTVGLRVDIDGLPIEESSDDSHIPAREGFRSETGAMHACGHDAHATIGLGVIEAIKGSDFSGTLKVFFQPAEEVVGGGRPMVESGHVDDVDYLFAVHVGLDHPTGEVVAGVEGFLAVSGFKATFEGQQSHAGGRPEQGRHAVLAMASAVQNLQAISRHSEGASRINAGRVGGGTASNIVPREAFIRGEVRGETTEIRDFMLERARDVIGGAAEMHDVAADMEIKSDAPSATSSDDLVDLVQDVTRSHPDVTRSVRNDDLGGSEDATFLMQHVQDNGGLATYVCVGTDHPGGHHSETFDVDEDSLTIAVDVLTASIENAAEARP